MVSISCVPIDHPCRQISRKTGKRVQLVLKNLKCMWGIGHTPKNDWERGMITEMRAYAVVRINQGWTDQDIYETIASIIEDHHKELFLKDLVSLSLIAEKDEGEGWLKTADKLGLK